MLIFQIYVYLQFKNIITLTEAWAKITTKAIMILWKNLHFWLTRSLVNVKLVFFPILLLILLSFCWSLFLTQVDVYNPATQQQGDTHPGQDEAVAKVSWSQLSGVLKDILIV